MYIEEVSIGSNSVSHFVLVAPHLFWSILLHGLHSTRLDEMASSNLLSHEQDGSRPSLVYTCTSPCIQERSGLVSAASVISFGLLICLDPFCRMGAQLDAAMDSFIVLPHERDGS